MKKIILFAFSLLLLYQVPMAQRDDDKPVATEMPPVKNIIKLSPFHFAEATFLMSYERMFGEDKSSLMFNVGVHSRENWWDGSTSFGFQEELQYRFYVAPPRNRGAGGGDFFYFKGVYAGPFVYHRYRDQDVQVWDWILQQNVTERQKINEFSGGVVMGVQFALVNRVYIDFYTGGGVKRSIGRRPDSQSFVDLTQVGYNGVLPKVGFQIGIGF